MSLCKRASVGSHLFNLSRAGYNDHMDDASEMEVVKECFTGQTLVESIFGDSPPHIDRDTPWGPKFSRTVIYFFARRLYFFVSISDLRGTHLFGLDKKAFA